MAGELYPDVRLKIQNISFPSAINPAWPVGNSREIASLLNSHLTMNHSHPEDWMTCTLCRANHQGQEVLERARRREVSWPEPREHGTPPIQDALAYTTIDEAFGSILQYMTTSSRQCRRYYSSIPASSQNALDRRHCGRFHAPRYTEPRKMTHPLQRSEDVHIQVQPGTYAVTAGGWGKGKGQQTHVVHVNQGQSVNLDFNL